MKRKRGAGKAPVADSDSAASKGLAPLSSNWLQLQAVLGQKPKYRNNSKKSETATPSTPADGDIPAIDGAISSLLPSNDDFSITKILALDCEMVGVGPEGKRNALARVTLVNAWKNVVYDKHVRPPELVTDFRTQVSGVRPRDIRKAEDFWTVQKEVEELLQRRILVGHALHNDLKVLLLSHPRKDMRDTQRYGRFRSSVGRPQALKHLAALHLGASIQCREHDSVEDARAALCLYQKFKDEWERDLKQRRMGNEPDKKQKRMGNEPDEKQNPRSKKPRPA